MVDGVIVVVVVKTTNEVQLAGVSEVRMSVFVAVSTELSSNVLVCYPVTSVVVEPQTSCVVRKLRKFWVALKIEVVMVEKQISVCEIFRVDELVVVVRYMLCHIYAVTKHGIVIVSYYAAATRLSHFSQGRTL